MDYRKEFFVSPGTKLSLAAIDPAHTGGHVSAEEALPEIEKHVARMDELQALLYADANQSLLIVLQALDAAGKDGVIRHVLTGMNPQGTSVSVSSSRAPRRRRTTSSGVPISGHRPGARSPSSTARITKTCSSCGCISWCRRRCGRNATR
jgi:hypothetical protein